ncbi:MAG: YmdB family metallophosphoesterase [Brachyspira sp.]|nr:YmdB family metallophosphoesterase [Brachyspira sp.]
MGDDKNTVKILFFGDMVGRPGRSAVRDFMVNPKAFNYKTEPVENPPVDTHFIIANVENASHGFGLTEKNYNELSEYGIDAMTSGNHIWDKKEIFNYINNVEKLLRPINYPNCKFGIGGKIFEKNGVKIGVISVLGRVFMNLVDSQWEVVQEEIKRMKEITPIVVVDFHAEATAEKICFGRFCAELGVSAFFGTHTHVQTADEIILNNMGYISDAGFCGTVDGVIGMEYQTSLNRFLTSIPERYEVADGNIVQINAVEVEIDTDTGYAVAIKRIFCSRNNKEEEESQ